MDNPSERRVDGESYDGGAERPDEAERRRTSDRRKRDRREADLLRAARLTPQEIAALLERPHHESRR